MALTDVEVRRALISVSDKTGLEGFASRLAAAGVELVSSGGTAAALERAGIPVTRVADVTGAPEILGGRVKTLHPRIHGGILADLGDATHHDDLQAHHIDPFQLVVVNLYPFRQTVARRDVSDDEVIEQIDIGGPAMLRAAAKNYRWVGAVTSADQYEEVAAAVEAGGLDGELRWRLAREAFFHTAAYDAAIVEWMERYETPPARMVLPLERTARLRYGENPHQSAALYRHLDVPSWWETVHQAQGKELSFNNLVDTDAAWTQVWEFDRPACVVVKHTNPAGVALGADPAEAFRRAWDCDPLSAFGSVIALNRPLDEATARAIAEAGFVEVVIAPELPGREPLQSKSSLRLLAADPPRRVSLDLRRVDGGIAAQTWDEVTDDGWRVVSSRQPTEDEWEDLRFAWRVAAHTKSNAIVIARDAQGVGIGAGDQSRVGAARRAIGQAGERAQGGVAASDAFFPFRDGIDALAAAGVRAVVEPGGSVRDDEVIAACEEHGLALVFTDRRHFRH